MNRGLFLLIITIMLLSKASAVSIDERYPYVVVLRGDTAAIQMTDSLFYSISRKVIFPVNKYTIPEDSEFGNELLSEILPYFNNNAYTLQSLMVRGAASPEGPYEWNKTLSRKRMEALLKLISDNSSKPTDSRVTAEEAAEDYVFLLLMMKERDDSDYSRVASAVNRYIDGDRSQLKRELMRIDGGRLWKRLLKEYFPEMRAARVVLFFKKRIDIQPEKPMTADFSEKITPRQTLSAPRLSVTAPMPRREYLSVKTNLLFDFAYMPGGYNRFCPIPNVAVEYYPKHGHFTYGASFDCPWWQDYDAHKYFQVRNYQIEARYYMRSGDVNLRGYGNGAAFQGLYFQAYTHAGLFGICFDEHRGWEGEGIGAGLGIGYVMPLTKKGHLRLEFGAQVGVFFSKYDPYQYESPIYPDLHDDLYYYKWKQWGNLFKKRQHRFTWIGPTRVGITISYDLLYRRKVKKGVSFRSWEVMK
jgi:hypothetical protein